MDKFETYPEALNYLFTFQDFSLTHMEQIAPERFELERMFDLMGLLGDLQKNYPTIHIAGTKGKGSVAALSASALQAAGYRTGLYTSPHLTDFRERIQVNGEWIPEEAFIEGMQILQEKVAHLPGLTSYELQTGLAFWYFAKAGVDCAVVEVGMGGRLDSTNILTPLVSVIANISFDHTGILGNTLAEIAGEKGGIIKPGVPVVTAPQQPEALEKLRQIAADKESPLILIGEDYTVEPGSQSLAGQEFMIRAKDGATSTLKTRLLGPHQLENAATAYAALKVVGEAGLPVSEEAIGKGFANVGWPGRFEIFEGQPTVVLDGAHNRHSAKMLAATMGAAFPHQPVTLIFGASEDKDIAGMFEELLPLVDEVYLAQAGHPRAQTADVMAGLVGGFAGPVIPIRDFDEVFAVLEKYAGQERVILVTGSLYLVGHFRGAWFQK